MSAGLLASDIMLPLVHIAKFSPLAILKDFFGKCLMTSGIFVIKMGVCKRWFACASRFGVWKIALVDKDGCKALLGSEIGVSKIAGEASRRLPPRHRQD